MNEVYVVTSGDYSDYHIDEIFSSNEDALKCKIIRIKSTASTTDIYNILYNRGLL